MAYPERLLSDNEVIASQFRPHWSGIIREIAVIFIGVGAAAVLAVIGAEWWAFVLVLAAVVLLSLGGLVRWYNTEHVITNERLIYRAGFFAKSGTEIPLEVIQNVAFNQTVWERVFGTGDLMVESAGTHGQTRYQDIPKPEAVQALIYKMREGRMLEVDNRSSAPESIASQLDTLSRLHDEGKLTDTEFAEQKSKLLGGAD